MIKAVNKKIFFILLILSLISVACVFPYVISLQGDTLRQLHVPIQTLFIAQFVQSAILFAIFIFLGLYFTSKIQFQLPLLEAIITNNDYKQILKKIARISVISGIAVAVAIYSLDALFTLAGVAVTTHQNYAPIWQKLLAAVYGGITEEIVTRLFLMTFFIWLSNKIFKQNQPNKGIIITSIFLAAIIFGLGHLPITASLTAITPLVILRAVILNGVGGVVFGFLFWKKGLESAMIAHFTADIFLLTILPLLIR